MLRFSFACLFSLFLAACAAPGETRTVVASMGSMQGLAQPLAAPVNPNHQVAAELECMSDCLADETCQACVDRCLE